MHIFAPKMVNQQTKRERLEFLINNGVSDVKILMKMTGTSRATVSWVKNRVKIDAGVGRKQGSQVILYVSNNKVLTKSQIFCSLLYIYTCHRN
jgi:hypothetical protein